MVCEIIGYAPGCFGRIPDVFWSGVISAMVAALVALIGIRSTNKSSLARLRAQHVADALASEKQRHHDAHQKAEDRKSVIRREVYTAAVESTHEMIAALAHLPERPSDAADDDEALQAFLAANSKVWLVADLEGAQLSRRLATEAGEAFAAIRRESIGFRVRMDPVRDLSLQIAFTSAEAQRVAQNNIDVKVAGASHEAFERGAAMWEEMMSWSRSRKAERDKLQQALSEERLEVAIYCMDALKPLQATLVKLVSALRFELGLDPAQDIFEAMAADQKRRMEALLASPRAEELPAV